MITSRLLPAFVAGVARWSAPALLLACFVTGCGKSEYVPDITLSPVRPILDATAEFHDLYPAPDLISGKDHFGLVATDVKRMAPNELADRVETELLAELDKAGVFTRIDRFVPQPDIVLAGRIDALYERTRPKLWTRIPGMSPVIGPVADVLDLRTHVSTGKADLTIIALKPNGEVIGRYRGTSSFEESFNPTEEMPPGARLNRALSAAVQQIQEQLVRDADLRRLAAR